MVEGLPAAAVVLAFAARVWEWRGPAPYYFVSLPEAEAEEVRAVAGVVSYGWGMIPAHVRIGATRLPTALWPKDGSYAVPLKDALRAAEGVALGDLVDVEVTITLSI